MTKKIFLLIFIFLQYFIVHGQNISGYVSYEETNEPILSANISISLLPDSLISAFTYTNERGFFNIEINFVPNKKYYLKVSHINAYNKYIPITNDDLLKSPLEIKLMPTSFILNDVQVSALIPAITKGDSTTYNVDLFRNGNEPTLEDVLRKMPNIHVESNGDVYFKNKRIEKILLDGDDLVGANYQMATRSIDPSVLDKVQAIEGYNDNKLLSQIEQSNQTILNLTVKDEKKNIFFGNTKVGIGNKFYDGVGSFFSYNKKIKAFSVLSINNVGLQRLNTLNEDGLNINEKSFDIEQKPNAFLPFINTPFNRPINDPVENNNNEKLGTLNLAFTPAKALKVNINAVLSTDERVQENFHRYQSLSDSLIRYHQFDTIQQNPDLAQIRLEGFYDYLKSTNLKYKSIFINRRIGLSKHSLLITPEDTLSVPEQFNNRLQESQHLLSLTKKVSTNTAIVTSLFLSKLQLNETLNTQPTSSIYREITEESQSSISTFFQNTIQCSKKLESQIGWLYGTKKRKFEQSFGYVTTKFRNDIAQFNATYNEEKEFEISRESFYVRNGVWFNWKILTVSGDVQLDFMTSTVNQRKQDQLISQSNFNFDFKLSKLSQFNLSYSKSSKPVSNTYLIDRYVLKDYRTGQRGVVDFIYDDNDQLSFNYSYFDLKRHNLTFITTLFTTRILNLWNFSDYTQASNYELNRLINTGTGNIKGLILTTEKLVYPLLGNIKLDFKLIDSRFSQVVNNQRQKPTILEPSTKIRYISVFDTPFNMEIGLTHRYFYLSVLQDGDPLTSTYSTVIQHGKLVYNRDVFHINLTVDNYQIDKNSTLLVKAKVDYKLSDKLKFSIEGINLLNQNTFKQISASKTFYSQSNINLLKRTVLFNISYVL